MLGYEKSKPSRVETMASVPIHEGCLVIRNKWRYV